MDQNHITLNDTRTISWKPSCISGSRNLNMKLENAERGRMDRFSGFNIPSFNARTVSLCSGRLAGAVKRMQRMGILNFRAS